MRPYIKNVVNEVKFTYVAEEYKTTKIIKSKKTKKDKKKKTKEIKEPEFTKTYENTVSLKCRNCFKSF